jgi:hypothetical protein
MEPVTHKGFANVYTEFCSHRQASSDGHYGGWQDGSSPFEITGLTSKTVVMCGRYTLTADLKEVAARFQHIPSKLGVRQTTRGK